MHRGNGQEHEAEKKQPNKLLNAELNIAAAAILPTPLVKITAEERGALCSLLFMNHLKSHSLKGATVNSRRNSHKGCRRKYKCGDLDKKMFFVHWIIFESLVRVHCVWQDTCGSGNIYF